MTRALPPNVALLIDIAVAWFVVPLVLSLLGILTGGLVGGVEVLLAVVIAITVVLLRHRRRIHAARTATSR